MPLYSPQQNDATPTARQKFSDVQETERNPTDKVSPGAGGSGVVVTSQLLPFHSSAKGEESPLPTVIQKLLFAHVTENSDVEYAVVANWTCCHVAPFHMTATSLESPAAHPTATHHIGPTHETDNSASIPDGSVIACQRLEESWRASPAAVPSWPLDPTAIHAPCAQHETADNDATEEASLGIEAMPHLPLESVHAGIPTGWPIPPVAMH